MAGVGITVCLPGEAHGRLAEAIGEAMAPFELDHGRGEELDVWDHWAISGGGSGFQALRGREGDPRLVPDGPGPSGRCAGGPRELQPSSLRTLPPGTATSRGGGRTPVRGG
ncbi:hypothetical protein [Streptomyces sp. NPDC002587]